MEKKQSKLTSLLSNNSQLPAKNKNKRSSVKNIETNPLNIPGIVAIVVENVVKVEDLKIIRALNKQWRDEAMKKWRRSAVFVITKETKLVLVKAFDDSAFTGLRTGEREKVKAEIDPFGLREIPFRNYRFEGDLVRTRDFELDLIFEKVIVPYANYLDLGEWLLSEKGKEFDPLEDIFEYNLSATELALTPLRKDDNYFAAAGAFNKEVAQREQSLSYKPPTEAPTVLYLTLLAPTPERQSELLGEKGLKPLFVAQGASLPNQLNYQNIVRWFFLKRMPNLKGIHVSSGNGMVDILNEMTDASRRGEAVIKLEEIEIPYFENPGYIFGRLIGYIRVVRPPLRKIKAVIPWAGCTQKYFFLRILRLVEETLTDLELEVDCRKRWSAIPGSLPEEDFFLNGRRFPNLTRFKVVMDYPEYSKGKFLSFDLNHLRKMPKLKEFFFGFKNPAEYIPERVISFKLEIPDESLAWVNEVVEDAPETHGIPEGIHFDPVLGQEVEGDGLKHLRAFHFHRNLTKSAVQLLGKWTKNLQTLEGIFDAENFFTARETWPSLQTLKLLQGSNVPKGLLASKSLKEFNMAGLDLTAIKSANRKRVKKN